MSIMHQIHQVKNQQITLTFPKHFSAQHVEVIILPLAEAVENKSGMEHGTQDDKTSVLRRFLTLDTSRFSAEQRLAYAKTCERLRQSTARNKPRIAGLFAGLIYMANDFNAPLPHENLFWGAQTDEYGMAIHQ